MRRLLVLLVLVVAGCAPGAERAVPKQIDELPLFEWTHVGDYDEFAGVDGVPEKPFGCSLFATAGLFARNFDWDAHPALVLHTDPPDGYASVSLVDMAYLDGDLSRAPLLPFDGMNSEGLAVGLAADESGRSAAEPGKPTVGSVRIIRLMLDHAAAVDEAIAVMQRFNVDFDGGPPLHYLLADRNGHTAVVEFIDGRMRVERGSAVLTNIRLIGVPEAGRLTDRRYRTASAAVAAGVADWREALGVLRDVAQPHTRWSVVYNLKTAEVHLVPGRRWDKVLTFRL